MVWLLFLLNSDTGGSIFVVAVPAAEMAPSTTHWNVLDSLVQLSLFNLFVLFMDFLV